MIYDPLHILRLAKVSDLIEDMAAKHKARTTYDNILRLVHDHDVCDLIKFLREREIVQSDRISFFR